MLDIWMSGIARAGGIEVSLRQQIPGTVRDVTPKTSVSLARWVRQALQRISAGNGQLLDQPSRPCPSV